MPWEDWDIVEGKRVGEPTPEARARANEHRALAVLFGDGAGAMIFRATDRDAGPRRREGPHRRTLRRDALRARRRLPDAPVLEGDALRRAGAHPADGRPRALQVRGHASCRRRRASCCEDTKTPIEQIDWFLAHQANARINNYVREHLGVPPEKMPMNIDRFGNTSAGTLPILIDECTRDGKLQKGELNMMLALGAGIHWGCALVRW